MSAYMIVSYDVVDPVVYGQYQQAALPVVIKHAGEMIVAELAAITLEGAARQVHAVLRFTSREAALAFYNDPAYQAASKLRQQATANSSVVITSQFVMPG
jgi:uncharacterized protein (DUF1330 family)